MLIEAIKKKIMNRDVENQRTQRPNISPNTNGIVKNVMDAAPPLLRLLPLFERNTLFHLLTVSDPNAATPKLQTVNQREMNRNTGSRSFEIASNIPFAMSIPSVNKSPIKKYFKFEIK